MVNPIESRLTVCSFFVIFNASEESHTSQFRNTNLSACCRSHEFGAHWLDLPAIF